MPCYYFCRMLLLRRRLADTCCFLARRRTDLVPRRRRRDALEVAEKRRARPPEPTRRGADGARRRALQHRVDLARDARVLVPAPPAARCASCEHKRGFGAVTYGPVFGLHAQAGRHMARVSDRRHQTPLCLCLSVSLSLCLSVSLPPSHSPSLSLPRSPPPPTGRAHLVLSLSNGCAGHTH